MPEEVAVTYHIFLRNTHILQKLLNYEKYNHLSTIARPKFQGRSASYGKNYARGSLQERIRSKVIRRQLKSATAHRISTLKWQWAGHINRKTDYRWDKRVLEWRPRLDKHRVGLWSGGVTICTWWELDASSRRSREISNWRGLCPAVECVGLMMMVRNTADVKIRMTEIALTLKSTNLVSYEQNGKTFYYEACSTKCFSIYSPLGSHFFLLPLSH
jgi:hypothetical protein